MGIFQKLFGSKRLTLRKMDIPSLEKVAEFVLWFIKHDSIVKAISSRSSNIIFNKGYRPRSGSRNNPESVNPNIGSLTEWFITRIFLDLNNLLKDATKDQFRALIDMYSEGSKDTLTTSATIGMRHGFNFENFIYEREIEKIPEAERVQFEENWLQDNVYHAQIRILSWLYHEYFGEWYQIKEHRSE